MEESGEKERVCVTGAGGFVASWVVKFLLSEGYMVHGTIRNPCDEKNGHLKKLENAAENLQIFEADLLDFEGLCAAIAGCTGVFHVACPVPSVLVPNPEQELIEPAVTGTRNVLNACSKTKVKRVVVVSSVGALWLNPDWPKEKTMDEECWSDREYCKQVKIIETGAQELNGYSLEFMGRITKAVVHAINNKNYYCLAKTIAESEALDYAKKSGLKIITVCPSVIIGPKLQPAINASSLFLLTLLKALLLAYKKPEAEGRYICTSYVIRMQPLVDMLKSMYPNYNYPKSFTQVVEDVKMSSEKLQKLGWKYRPLEETIADAVKNYEESGILRKNKMFLK